MHARHNSASLLANGLVVSSIISGIIIRIPTGGRM